MSIFSLSSGFFLSLKLVLHCLNNIFIPSNTIPAIYLPTCSRFTLPRINRTKHILSFPSESICTHRSSPSGVCASFSFATPPPLLLSGANIPRDEGKEAVKRNILYQPIPAFNAKVEATPNFFLDACAFPTLQCGLWYSLGEHPYAWRGRQEGGQT